MNRLQVAPAVLAVLASAALLASAAAVASNSIPGYAFKFAGGHESTGYSWGLWLFGARHGQDCWATRSGRGDLKSEGVTCGLSVPERAWQLAANGIVGGSAARQRVLAFLTRTSAWRVKVLTERITDHERRWVSIRVHGISRRTAWAARLSYPVGYAVLVVPESICGKSVRILGRQNRLIAKGGLTCSGRQSNG